MRMMSFFSRFVPTVAGELTDAHRAMIDAMVLIACADGEVTADEYNIVLATASDFIGASEVQVQPVVEATFDLLDEDAGWVKLLKRLAKLSLSGSERQGVYVSAYGIACLEPAGVDEEVREHLDEIAGALSLQDDAIETLEADYDEELARALPTE